MSKNQFKPVADEVPPKEAPAAKPRKPRQKDARLGKALRSVLDGTILTRENVVKLIPFGLYVTLLILIYIANSYYAEKSIKKANRIRNELKELEYEFITSKSDMMHNSKQSEVARRLDSLGTGIRESVVPPTKIYVISEEKPEEKP